MGRDERPRRSKDGTATTATRSSAGAARYGTPPGSPGPVTVCRLDTTRAEGAPSLCAHPGVITTGVELRVLMVRP